MLYGDNAVSGLKNGLIDGVKQNGTQGRQGTVLCLDKGVKF